MQSWHENRCAPGHELARSMRITPLLLVLAELIQGIKSFVLLLLGDSVLWGLLVEGTEK